MTGLPPRHPVFVLGLSTVHNYMEWMGGMVASRDAAGGY